MLNKQMLFAQLPAAQQELALQRFQIIEPFLEGRNPLTQIVQAHALSLRTARRWVQRYRADGLVGLVRSARTDRGARRGMPPEMEQFIQDVLRQERAASVAALYRRVLQMASEQGWPTPSYSRVYALARTFNTLPHTSQTRGLSRSSPPAPQLSFLEAKLHRPRVPADLVRRERLFARLDEGCQRTLTLLSAPAGFGKTTLVCQWMAERRATLPIAWVSLDTEDNDPSRFWRYVLTACQRLLSNNALSAAGRMVSVPARDEFWATAQSSEEALATLFHTFTDAPGGILVLEDYHVIVEPQIHQMLAFLLNHLPETLHLFLITRADPPLSLAKLRASGNLSQVLAADLRFSLREMQLFLQQVTPFPLGEEIIERINTRLDGWAAGLRLLSHSLQEQSSLQGVEQMLTAFTGNHRPLQAYFVSEVLAGAPANVQDFLLRTSILGRLTAFLCNTLTAREDSAQMLAVLERSGFFLEALDDHGQWYRYQALFAEAIRAEARQRLGADTLQLLAQRASQWFEKQGLLSQAIEMAFQAGNIMRTIGLIEQYIPLPHYKELQEYHTLFRWLKQIPLAQLTSSSVLCLSYAQVLVFASPTDQLESRILALVRELLMRAEIGFGGGVNSPALGEVFALRALISWRQDALLQAAAAARQALALLPTSEVLWCVIAEHVLGVEALFNGQLHLARRAFQQTRALGQKLFTQAGSALLAWGWGKELFTRTATAHLAWTCLLQGELQLAAEYYRQIVRETHESSEHLDRVYALLSLAWIAYEWNDLDNAADLAQQASQSGGYQAQVLVALLQARVLQARGESASALQLLAEFQGRQVQFLPHLERAILAAQASIHLALDNLSTVQHWATEHANPPQGDLPRFQYEKEVLLKVRLHLAQGHAQQALSDLQCLLDEVPEREHSRNALEIQVLLALAEAANKQGAQARQRIHTVLSLAQPERYQRLFLDEGEPMARLLRGLVPYLQEAPLKTYLQQLLQAFEVTQPALLASSLLEALSPQELRVLRLLANGSSAPQIAQQLIVSVTTVRTQIQSIYRKLQVNNRVEASSAAHALNLLS
jgi:LuxR family transcriptional regulator, maltose regulon positive regulatory protein